MADTPFMYGRSASGIDTEPSFCWQFSRIAISVRPTARPEPFSVCDELRLAACRRRGT